MPRMLDLFCGRWGWSKAFAARGWECLGVDLKEPDEVPANCIFVKGDVREINQCGAFLFSGRDFSNGERSEGGKIETHSSFGRRFDFVCASSPCEEFSVFGMRHFHPNPPYPELGIKLFNYTRALCESAGVPHVMENVRTAQQFVGKAVNHCGPFYLWGNAVPPIMPQGIVKGLVLGGGGAILKMIANGATRDDIRKYRQKHDEHWNSSKSEARKKSTATFATIPPELANCVADYAERLLEQNVGAAPCGKLECK